MTIALRAPTLAEAAEAASLLNARLLALHGVAEWDADELEMFFRAPTTDRERDARFAAAAGKLVGYADVYDAGSAHRVFWSSLSVRPGADTGEVGGALLEWLERRIAESAAEGAVARVPVLSDDHGLKRVLEQRGYRIVRHTFRMAVDLDAEPEPAQWPHGIAVRTLRPEDEHAAYATHQEAFEDMWGFTPEPFEEWRFWACDSPQFDPTLWFLAWADDRVAGIAICAADANEPQHGWVHILGVRPPWRRRGVAEALLRHAFAEFAGRGYRRVVLGVDAASPTGAVRLYERVGMRVLRQRDTYEKEIRPATL